jgi:hypothetical protein
MNSPIVIMGPPTYEGGQPCTMRVKDVTPRGFSFQLDEWKYLDGGHVQESINYMVFDEGVQTIMGMTVEAGKVENDEDWITVPITSNPSTTPVVIAQCVSYTGSDPVTVRIRNITTTSFEIKLQEEEAEGDHCNEIIHYIVVEPGRYGNFEVKRVNNIDDSWTTITGLSGGGLSGPFMTATIQTYNGSDPAALRKDHVTGTDYRIKVEEEKSDDSETAHADETVGILNYYYIIM